jgi:hypothetical protein
MPTKQQIEAIIKELQRILAIPHWEILFDFCDKYKMKDLTGDGDNWASCNRNMQRNCAHIHLNVDADKEEWYDSIVHELYHVVTQDWCYHSRALLDYVTDDTTHTKEENGLNIYYESTIDRLTRGFVNAYPVSNFRHILEVGI